MQKTHLTIFRTILLYGLVLIMAVATPISTLYAAEDTENCDTQIDYGFYRTNRVIWKDECKTATGCVAGGAAGDVTGGIEAANLDDLKASPVLEKIFQDLLNGGMTAIQAAAVMGNMYTESAGRFDPDIYEIGVPEDVAGYGLVQWTGSRRTDLENYAQTQGVAKSDLDLQMRFLFVEYNATYKASLANGAFGKSTSVPDATDQWMKIFENPLQEGADPAKVKSERIPAAKKIYDLYKDLTPAEGATPADEGDETPGTTGDAATTTCDGANGAGTEDSAVAGDIVGTALGYAWPDPVDNGVNEKADATPAYQVAKPKYAPAGLWSDCGAFVATVMIASGVDPDFPTLRVSIQAAYVRDHPEKYTIIENATLDDIQPGDILIEDSTDHIEIAKGGAEGIDASNFQRVPSVRPTGAQYMVGQGSFIARFIGENE